MPFLRLTADLRGGGRDTASWSLVEARRAVLDAARVERDRRRGEAAVRARPGRAARAVHPARRGLAAGPAGRVDAMGRRAGRRKCAKAATGGYPRFQWQLLTQRGQRRPMHGTHRSSVASGACHGSAAMSSTSTSASSTPSPEGAVRIGFVGRARQRPRRDPASVPSSEPQSAHAGRTRLRGALTSAVPETLRAIPVASFTARQRCRTPSLKGLGRARSERRAGSRMLP